MNKALEDMKAARGTKAITSRGKTNRKIYTVSVSTRCSIRFTNRGVFIHVGIIYNSMAYRSPNFVLFYIPGVSKVFSRKRYATSLFSC